MSYARSISKKENVGLVVAALIFAGFGLLGEPFHIPLYMLDLPGGAIGLLLSGGEAADGIPGWMALVIAELVNVALYYYVFKLIVQFWKRLGE